MARWSIFLQFLSSVASESGVLSVGHMSSHGMGGPRILWFHASSQLGRAVVIVWWVKSLVSLLMVRWVSDVIAYCGSGWGSRGDHPLAMGNACDGGPRMRTVVASSSSASPSLVLWFWKV